jgi:hypothetical protein
MIINGVERYGWKDGYRVLEGYGSYENNSNKGGPACRSLSEHSLDPKDVAAAAANKASRRMVGN